MNGVAAERPRDSISRSHEADWGAACRKVWTAEQASARMWCLLWTCHWFVHPLIV